MFEYDQAINIQRNSVYAERKRIFERKTVRKLLVECADQSLADLLTKIKFVKRFVNIKKYIKAGIRKFASEVRSKKYPTKKYSY